MTANIVLGLGYGDEGKGITTDYLCSQNPKLPIVIRFSGGQQAGHTVMLDGKKHVHASFGAGTLRGVPSYFSEHTCIYPVTMMREYDILVDKGVTPKLIVHPLAKVTTPFDVYANRLDLNNVEHGTCGLGIGKTMKRNESPYKLHAIDLLNSEVLFHKLWSIRNYYKDLLMETPGLIDEINAFEVAVNRLPFLIMGYDYLHGYDNLIFEGSQGILLDMTHGIFPNVTYANTTSKNAHEILDKLGCDNRHIYYVTRSYHTRHGGGMFHQSKLDLVNTEHETNVLNEWQGEFKTAPLKYGLLNHALNVDDIYSANVPKNLMVTCLDQFNKFDFQKLEHQFDNIYESNSPYTANIKKFNYEHYGNNTTTV